jgi:hypothetical protein
MGNEYGQRHRIEHGPKLDRLFAFALLALAQGCFDLELLGNVNENAHGPPGPALGVEQRGDIGKGMMLGTIVHQNGQRISRYRLSGRGDLLHRQILRRNLDAVLHYSVVGLRSLWCGF